MSTTTSNKTTDHSPPDHLVCPLTLELMTIPFRDSDSNRSYERSAILEWIWFGNNTCPLTRKPLKLSNFSVNKELMLEIYEWKRENGLLSLEEGDGGDCLAEAFPQDSTVLPSPQLRTELKGQDDKLKEDSCTFPTSLSRPVPSYLKQYL
jgi:U-box domain